jgi:hypothetical protein
MALALLVVHDDMASNLVDARLLGADGIMLEAHALPNLVEQANRTIGEVWRLGYFVLLYTRVSE